MKTFFDSGQRIAVAVFLILSLSIPVAAEELFPAEDREITRQFHGEGLTELLADGQFNPGIGFVTSPEYELRFILRYDLSAYSGLQVANATLSFFVKEANDFDSISLDVWYFGGDGTVTAEDFDGGDILAGTYSLDTDPGGKHTIEQWAEIDVTDVINARSGEQVYFNIRLSGGYPDYLPNVFGTTEAHHYVVIAASEYGTSQGPSLSLEGPYVGAGGDRKVYDSVVLDGSQSFDPVGQVISYQWLLQCRGNPIYSRSAVGETATVRNLRPGFYDVYLTVENDVGQTATGGFVLLSTPQESGDLDGDGDIDGQDVAVFADKFGQNGP